MGRCLLCINMSSANTNYRHLVCFYTSSEFFVDITGFVGHRFTKVGLDREECYFKFVQRGVACKVAKVAVGTVLLVPLSRYFGQCSSIHFGLSQFISRWF